MHTLGDPQHLHGFRHKDALVIVVSWCVLVIALVISIFSWLDINHSLDAYNDIMTHPVMGPPPSIIVRDVRAAALRLGESQARPTDELNQNVFGSPDVKERLIELEIIRGLDYQYGRLFQLLSLNRTSIDRLKGLLVKRQRLIDAAFRAHRAEGNAPDDPQEWPAIGRAATISLDKDFISELGEDGFRMLSEYSDTNWMRIWMERANTMLYADGLSIDTERMERMITIMASENISRGLYPSISSTAVKLAASFLSPNELAAVEGIAAELHARKTLYDQAQKQLSGQK